MKTDVLHTSNVSSTLAVGTKEGKTMHWEVYTPQYMNYGSPFDLEPPEYTCDWVVVEAETRRQALVEGVRELRRIGSDWILDQQSDGASPFTGLKANKMLCEHGFCHCGKYDCISPNSEYLLLSECPECLKEWEKEYGE